MDLILRLVLASLAAYRLAQLITLDSGPFHVFKNLRGYTKKLAVENSKFSSLAEGITCPFCVGIWMSFLCAIVIMFPSFGGDLFLIGFGLAGIQTVLERYTV